MLNISCSNYSKENKLLNSFAQDFKIANESNGLNLMLDLYSIESMDPDDLSILKVALGFELGLPIKDIYFKELDGSPEETISFEKNGEQYEASISPKKKMIVIYDTLELFTSEFTIGLDSNKNWKIITAVPETK